MIIVEELERLLEKRGWYLHKIEFLSGALWGRHMEHYGDMCRCMIRFPCRPPCYIAVYNDDTVTAKTVLREVKKHVRRR